ncbi:MAG: hypothetical protein ACK4JE_01700, partial [Endomicrobiia bacterium]
MNKIFILDDGNYALRLETAFKELKDFELKKFNSLKELYSSIVQLKPQIILLNVTSAKKSLAKKIIKFYPFIPVVVYGEFGKNVKKINKTTKQRIKKTSTEQKKKMGQK